MIHTGALQSLAHLRLRCIYSPIEYLVGGTCWRLPQGVPATPFAGYRCLSELWQRPAPALQADAACALADAPAAALLHIAGCVISWTPRSPPFPRLWGQSVQTLCHLPKKKKEKGTGTNLHSFHKGICTFNILIVLIQLLNVATG